MSDPAGFADFRKRKDQNLLQILNRILLILIALLVIIGLVSTFVPILKERAEQKNALEQIRQQVDEQKQLFLSRTKEVSRLNNDPEYLGFIARDKLDLMKPGETIFRFGTNGAAVAPVNK